MVVTLFQSSCPVLASSTLFPLLQLIYKSATIGLLRLFRWVVVVIPIFQSPNWKIHVYLMRTD